MRIALVTEFYYPHLGGVTEHVHNLALELIGAGHHAIIVTSRMGDWRDGELPPVRRIGTSRVIYSSGSFARVTTGWALSQQLRRLLCEEGIELVHVHGGLAPTLGLVAPRVAKRMGIPVVATFHSWFAHSHLCRIFRAPLQRRLDEHAAMIAVSLPVVQAHSRYFDAPWEIIPNGVDTRFFHPSARASAPRDGPGPELLFLGRLDPRNGLDTALAALPRVADQHPGVRLTVVGDGPLRAYYERMARPVSRWVRFVGSANGDRPQWYTGADLYLCPTTKASFGITLLEAMSCGVPQIVSDVTGFRELIAGGEEAVLAPVGDAPAWSDSVLTVIADPVRRLRMAAAGRCKAESFAWPVVAGRVMEVYRRVLR
jgi:phosphatidylinositol alpha-mannosyltransferase